MPIIHLCDATHPGATGHHYGAGQVYNYETREYGEGPRAHWTYETHHGLCLFEREANYYDDSDFFMTVWNDAKGEPEEIMFATTRGWSYPCYASRPDATPETIAKYEAWKARKDAEARAAYRLTLANKRRAMRAAIRKTFGPGDTFVRALRLRRKIGDEKFNRLVTFAGRKLRSEFKLSMLRQVTDWLANPAPRYDMPLSAKQWEYVR